MRAGRSSSDRRIQFVIAGMQIVDRARVRHTGRFANVAIREDALSTAMSIWSPPKVVETALD